VLSGRAIVRRSLLVGFAALTPYELAIAFERVGGALATV
jgi:hypothetical protein